MNICSLNLIVRSVWLALALAVLDFMSSDMNLPIWVAWCKFEHMFLRTNRRIDFVVASALGGDSL